MSDPILAERVVDLLARRKAPAVDGHRETHTALTDTVTRRLRLMRLAAALDAFDTEPDSGPRRRALVDLLDRQFAQDPAFHETVAEMVRTVAPPDRGDERVAVRRAAVGVAAALAAVVLVIGARAAYVAVADGAESGGSMPCHTFWSLPEAEQRALLAELYRSRNEPLRATEPYIVASVLYSCGQNPDSTVGEIVSA
ncbi:hypothetical protein [Actinokineospora iranica]|uniref:Uncharacterized protein n=1 Tax=Actinokineospora iranica TaxID=1271860 RepID=A0A1G6TIK3_9PSEU|nr:hypothetical protein [Actinokineospora iranica]SDD28694.1 hypothetical protein SAMN05216174_109156 [Actinokineospora iranica]